MSYYIFKKFIIKFCINSVYSLYIKNQKVCAQ